jgi:hypothetical protein
LNKLARTLRGLGRLKHLHPLASEARLSYYHCFGASFENRASKVSIGGPQAY